MRILITGANGLLGQQLTKHLLQTTDYELIATGKGPCRLVLPPGPRWQYVSLDLTDGMAVSLFCSRYQPDVVIHAAARTQADDCERDPIGCWAHNVTAIRFLLDALQLVRPYFIFLSTDFVFDGEAGPYKETDWPQPVNYYGSSKVAGEKAVLASGLCAAIVRTCLVYGNIAGGSRHHFTGWVKDSLRAGTVIRVVDDQWRTPTFVEDLAGGILLLIHKHAEGIFHVAGPEWLTPYQMALQTANYHKLDTEKIIRVTADHFTQPAKRPPKTGFDISVMRGLGYDPVTFTEGLARMALV
jgi:dTDP-4-dehydrorhamnose reductase